MELNNEFRVGVPPTVAWSVLNDIERIAPCMPGAQLQEIEGDEFRGIVKVKVGPITAQYKGKATFLERDEASGHLVLRAEGRDTRGQGNANATITANLAPDGDATKVTVVTDLTVTGKVAQFGRGVLAEVSAKLLNQFVDCLERDVLAAGHVSQDPVGAGSGGGPGPEAASEATPSAATPQAAPVATEAPPAVAAGQAPPAATPNTVAADLAAGPDGSSPSAAVPREVRKIDHPEAAPVDLIEAAGGSVARRVVPIVAAVLVVLGILRWRRARRGGR